MKTNVWYGDVEYRMTKDMAKSILLGKNKSGNTQKILCDWVNENCMIKGNCVRVSTDL